MNLCKWTKQKKMEGDVCSHTGDLISSPQAQFQLCVWGKLSALCCFLELNPLSIACESIGSGAEPFWTQESISAEGLVLESRSKHSSTERGLAFIFHLAETKNWG